MGCQVVSVYNDQVIGKVGYPESILSDLIDRDYRQLKTIEKFKNISKTIKHIYGCTQSHAISQLFFTLVAEKEYVVYPAGRFIVMEETKTKQQLVMTNPDFISAFTVDKKLCLVGLIGGTLLLWDLQFREVKLEILLPQQSSVVSSVGLTSKYVFATDSCTPNNNVFCFDLRTAKRVGHKVIPSFEPTLRSINVGQNLHVTVCADGVWFFKMSKQEKDLQVVKGMFGRYPKTSMTCLGRVGDFVISGAVDGYVYVWRIKTMKCCRALKVNDNEIISIGVKNKHIVFGCMTGRMKVYTFQVTKRQKAEYVFEVKEDDDDNEEDVAFIVVDAYNKEAQTVAIAVSVIDPLLYYCMTREGLIFQKWLPAPTTDRRLMNLKLNANETIQKINTTGSVVLQGDRIYSAYRGGTNTLFVDIYSLVNNQLKLQEERVALLKEDCQPKHISYSAQTEQIAYFTITNKLQVSLTFNKITESVAHQNKSDAGANSQNIQQIENQQLLLVQYSQQFNQLLFVTTNQTIWVYERTTKLSYQEKCHVKFQNKLPQSIKVDERQFTFDKDVRRWQSKDSQLKSIPLEKMQYHKLIHNAALQSLEQGWASKKASVGGGLVVLWQQY